MVLIRQSTFWEYLVDQQNRFLRNKDLIDQAYLTEVHVIGAGGIGSSVVPLLSIMGFKHIVIYDHDNLKEHNLSSSLYPEMFLDMNKAEAAAIQAREYNPNIHVDNFGEWWSYMWDSETGMGKKCDLRKVIVCPDNMEVRLDAYDAWKAYIETIPGVSNTAFFIDIRMDALALEVITVTPYNMDAYENYWKPSKDIEDAPCTMKHTIFTSSISAGFGVNQVFNVLGKRPFNEYIWIGLVPLQIKKKGLIIPK